MKKILFISHDDTLTGAPILLMNLMSLVNEKHEYMIMVLIKNCYGSLLNDYQTKFNTYIFNDFRIEKKKPKIFNFLERKKKIKNEKKKINLVQCLINESDFIFSNTITNGDILRNVTIPKNCKVITYVHELKMGIDFFTSKENLDIVLKKSDLFAVPSNAVKACLKNYFNLTDLQILTINYVFPYTKDLSDVSDLNKKSESLGFTIGIIGTLDWRKGAELIPVFLKFYFDKYSNDKVDFLWQGVSNESIELKRIKYELSITGLIDKIKFIPQSKNTRAFYNDINIHLLLSKEDPYPLVVLEAASYEKPTICFSNAGGAMEFVEQDSGMIIPFLDLEMLSDAVHDYYMNREKITLQGKNARSKYLIRHCDKDLIYDQFKSTLKI